MKICVLIVIVFLQALSAQTAFEMKPGFTFDASLNDAHESIQFKFEFPEEFYISIGFGYTMQNAPMVVVFDKVGDGETTPMIMDVYSTNHHKPKDNTENIYKMVDASYFNGAWTVIIERPLDISRDGRDESINLDQSIAMQYAFHKAAWKKHTKNDRGIFNMTIDSVSGRVSYNKLVMTRDVFYLAHGIILYITWSILTFFIVASGRYMKHLYNFRMILHIALGLLMTISTLIIVLISLFKYPSYTVVKYNHSPIGITVTALSVAQTLGGFASKISNSKSRKNLKFAKFSKIGHKLFGFILIFLSNLEVATGMYCYRTPIRKLIFIHFTVMVLCIALFEYIYSLHFDYFGKGVLKKSDLVKYTREEFDSLVQQGRKVVLFNNYIIDVASFIDEHPGTALAITQNIGQDVGKYIFGATGMNCDVPKYCHSSYSIKILEKLAIGKMCTTSKEITEYWEKPTPKESVFVVEEKSTIFDDVVRVKMRVLKQKEAISRKHQVNDLRYSGMGYSITSLKDQLCRYYTICDCMRDEVYQRYCKIFTAVSEGSPIEDTDTNIQDLFDDSLEFVVKKYPKAKTGMSVRLSNASDLDKFYVNGPLGKPFDFSPENSEGINVIFCAGTGILPFMDLFAYLGRKIMNEEGHFKDEEFNEIGEKSQFIIHAYFSTRESCIGIELVEAVQKLYQKHHKGYKFNLNLTLTQSGGEKLTDDSLLELLQDYSDANQGINRLMVCGPPPMECQFQRLSSKIIKRTHLPAHMFHIL
ncbi:unnamed protein product [Moneuplotes crassus]|uniref:Uncharacterized protein n=1 Tax=Euplotes crassus TaxID=5936 RepID=A0AAD1Y9M5_EUPCR|nr:unnamed protein product [Moneuplotes crassus]